MDRAPKAIAARSPATPTGVGVAALVEKAGLPPATVVSSRACVADWSRREVCTFTKGILAASKRVSNNASEGAGRATTRAFFTWRLVARTAARTPPLRATGTSSAEAHEAESTRSLRSRAVLRLNALYLQQLGDGEKVREELRERRTLADNSAAFSAGIPLSYAKRFIIVQMSARVKRCMRFSFDRWKVFLQNTLDKMRIKSLELELHLGQQSIRSRKGQIEEMREMNKNLSDFMACAKSFYVWKSKTIDDILRATQSASMAVQSTVFRELRDIKTSLLESTMQESKHVEDSARFGDGIVSSLVQLEELVSQISGLPPQS